MYKPRSTAAAAAANGLCEGGVRHHGLAVQPAGRSKCDVDSGNAGKPREELLKCQTRKSSARGHTLRVDTFCIIAV